MDNELDERFGGTANLDRGRRLSRRRMARISFLFLILSGTSILSMLMLHPDRLEIAQALAAASMVVTPLLSVLTAIVLAYLGVSAAEQVFKK
jgi:hypothetical protein